MKNINESIIPIQITGSIAAYKSMDLATSFKKIVTRSKLF
tara:strand:+ start:336 stop:455 length:120 start_codon:yes stop_codon:yes gene_type:complete